MSTHTKTPWSVDEGGALRGCDLVGRVIAHNRAANAAFIVRAVNAHDDLVAALKEVMDWISNWDPNFVQDDEWTDTSSRVLSALARAAQS